MGIRDIYREYKANSRKTRASDYLPFEELYADGDILTKDWGLMRCFLVDYPDTSTSDAEADIVSDQVRDTFQGFSLFRSEGKASYWFVLQRVPRQLEIEPETSGAVNMAATDREIEDHRISDFTDGQRNNENLTYACVKVSTMKFDGGGISLKSREMAEAVFREFESMLFTIGAHPVRLTTTAENPNANIMTFVKRMVGTGYEEFRCPANGMKKFSQFVSSRPIENGKPLKIGDTYVQTLTINSYPSRTNSNMLVLLETLPFCFRWVTRWMPLTNWDSQQEAKKLRGQFKSGVKSWKTMFYESTTGNTSNTMEIQSVADVQDMEEVLGDLSQGETLGKFTSVIVLMADSIEELDRQKKIVKMTVQKCHFDYIEEGPEANLLAWLSTIPGDSVSNPRQPYITASNLSHIIPFTNVYHGSPYNEFMDQICGNGFPHVIGRLVTNELYYLNLNGSGDIGHCALFGATGCHAKGTLVLMADGSTKPVEDIMVGDRVMGDDGTPRTVLQLHHGEQMMYRIKPLKGDSFVVNEGHYLSLYGLPGEDRIEITVKEYLEKDENFKYRHYLYYCPGVEKFEVPQADLPVPPYVLGIILGDGDLQYERLSVTTPDLPVLNAFAKYLADTGYSTRYALNTSDCPSLHASSPIDAGTKKRGYLDPFRELGLLDHNAHNKFIPAMYKTASWEDRLELLAGLLDTDGHLEQKKRSFDYISASKQLAEDVAFVARSLGFYVSVRKARKGCQTGHVGTYWRLNISGDLEKIPCRVERKKYVPRDVPQKRRCLLTGFTIEEEGIGEYFGMTIDGNHLFCLGNFMVQRNSGKSVALSLFASQWMRYPNSRVILFDKDMSFEPICRSTGGSVYIPLGDDSDVQFMPLGRLNDSGRSDEALAWLECMMESQNIPYNPKTSADFDQLIQHWGNLPPTLEQFYLHLKGLNPESPALPAIRRIIDDPGLSRLFGGTVDSFSIRNFTRKTMIEMGPLMDRGTIALLPALQFMFSRMDELFDKDPKPTLLIMDEAWRFMSHPYFRKKIKEWLKTLRKKNVFVMFAFQNINDVDDVEEFLTSCHTRIFLPNPDASPTGSSIIREKYLSMGLKEGEVDIIGTATPKKHYYIQQDEGCALVDFCVDRFQLERITRRGF